MYTYMYIYVYIYVYMLYIYIYITGVVFPHSLGIVHNAYVVYTSN